VDLNFYPLATSQLTEAICPGDSYFFGNQNLTQSGTYTNTLSSSQGCDSIITLFLTVKVLEKYDHVTSGCTGADLSLIPNTSGVSYLWNNGATTDSIVVNSDGTYIVSVSDIANCVIAEETFIVTFGQLSIPAFAIPGIICPGTDLLLTASGSSGNYQWFDDAGGNNLIGTGSTLLLPNIQSDDTVYVSAFQPGIDNCVSFLVPVPFALEDEAVLISADTLICAGNSVELPWGESVIPEMNTSYSHTWQNVVTGCDSLELTVDVGLIFLPPLSIPSSFTIQLGDSVLLVPQIDFIIDSIRWSPAEGLSCTDCLQAWAYPTESTDYEISAWSVDGCLTTAIVRIEVRRDVKFYIPNVFTPDGDGVNDVFTVYGNKEILLVRRLSVFDRWGDALWQGVDFPADGSIGWDGMFRGREMMSGVYAWVCEIEKKDGSRQILKGDVTLVR
ncbi:MAG: T9SS type B sorting domain-containing protein, partial [Saprospiraceae bacterium]